jgi:hypothetical protein
MRFYDLWEGIDETGAPHKASSPLTDGAVTNATEPGLTQPESRFSLIFGFQNKPKLVRALRHALAVLRQL